MWWATFDPNASILAGVDRATLQLWLSQAQTALMQVMTGQFAQSVSSDGQSVSFVTADVPRLEAWIYLLQRQLGIGFGRRAIRPYFR